MKRKRLHTVSKPMLNVVEADQKRTNKLDRSKEEFNSYHFLYKIIFLNLKSIDILSQHIHHFEGNSL